MFLRTAFLSAIGLCAGGVIAAGIFAFLVMIGVYPRIIGKLKAEKHIMLYDTVIVAGGVAGNVIDLFEIPMVMPFGVNLFLMVAGLAVGIFVGCLFMSLAETLKALPVLSRRIRLAVGLQYVILSIAMGKFFGALLYFVKGIG